MATWVDLGTTSLLPKISSCESNPPTGGSSRQLGTGLVAKIKKAELARRLGWHLPQVDRVLDINHRSRLDSMDAALGALDCRLTVETTTAA